MPARARLPDNLIAKDVQATRLDVLKLHADGTLFAVHRFIAERLNAFEAEMANDGTFWLGDDPVSDNALWCLLRRDVEAQSFPIPPRVLRRVVDISFGYIRKKRATLAQGERALIVSLED
jgi:hypothetical protein